jgi:predicted kinase
MPRLIHLNGPSGVGKSTVAQMYVDRHPGVLNLDADQLISLVGGWQDDFWATLNATRLLAISMAETHLRSGHDVVMPQLIVRVPEVERFEAAAERAGAEYHEVVLMASKRRAFDRFTGRALGQPIDQIIAHSGGPTLLEQMYDRLTAFLRDRPDCVVVDTDGRDAAQTYEAVLDALVKPR